MSIEIRRLATNELVQFIDLLRTEREANDAILWQDRSPDLLRIYEPYRNEEAIYFGAFNNGELVGGSGIIPVMLRDGVQACMDTDLFVAPAFRQSRVAYELVRFRFLQNDFIGSHFYFGIEETPQQLAICTSLAKQQNLVFDFIGHTNLRHDYLLHAETPKEFNLEGVKIVGLTELNENEKRNWLNKCKDSSPLIPRLDIEIFKRLAQLDPEAKAILAADGSRAVLLSQRQARKFRISKNQNLMITKLARFRGEILAPDSELRMGILGLIVPGDASATQAVEAPLKKLFQGVGHLAAQKKFQVIVSRDLGESPKNILSNDVAEFQRRIFLMHRPGDPFAESCRQEIKNLGCGKMDSLFL